MRYHKLFFYLIVILILTPTTFYSTPQEVFAVSRIAFDNVDDSLGTSDVCIINALDVAIGDFVVVFAGDGQDGGATITVVDEDTNVWTQRINADDNTENASQFMFTAEITTANGANDITVTWTSANNFACAGIVYSGVDLNDPVEATNFTMCNSTDLCAVAITPVSTNNIMVGSCQSDWNSAHDNTFDATATGTERSEINRAGGDNLGLSTIDMFTFTDTSQKDWTCDDNRSNRDLSVQMAELNSAPVNPIDPMTMTDLVGFNFKFPQNPMTMTDDITFDHTKNVPLLYYYEEDTTCTSPISVNTDIVTITDGTDFDFQDGRSYLIIATSKFNYD